MTEQTGLEEWEISNTKHSLAKGLWRVDMVPEEQKGSGVAESEKTMKLSSKAGEPELDGLGEASGSGGGFCSFPSGFGAIEGVSWVGGKWGM